MTALVELLVLFALLVGLSSGCADSCAREEGGWSRGADLRRFHDDEAGVTCWELPASPGRAGALSCLRDEPAPPYDASSSSPWLDSVPGAP